MNLLLQQNDNQDNEEVMSAGMVVAIRIKPLDDDTPESQKNEMSVVAIGENAIELKGYEPKQFYYDFTHWSTKSKHDKPRYASQEIVFQDVGRPVIDNSIKGFNCTLFAYGQTGSGKTYTMMGGKEAEEGIIPRVCKGILNFPYPPGTVCTFTVSYIEIFKEKVKDLLANETNAPQASSSSHALKVREHPSDGPFVEGAVSLEVSSYDECRNIFTKGSNRRQVAATQLNDVSSRSHAIFTLKVTQAIPIDVHSDECEDVNTIVSKVNLVDLAGSENSLVAGTTGERLKEGAAINKSLLTLGRVIKALADQSRKARRQTIENDSLSPSPHITQEPNDGNVGRSSTASTTRRQSLIPAKGGNLKRNSSAPTNKTPGHDRRLSLPAAPTPISNSSNTSSTLIPYRDSVLTYLLKESLGGNSKTTMIATIRPGMQFIDETGSTLRYAAQAKKIVNVVRVNENPYVKTIKLLQQQVELLTKQLQIANETVKHIAEVESLGEQPTEVVRIASAQVTTSLTATKVFELEHVVDEPIVKSEVTENEGDVDEIVDGAGAEIVSENTSIDAGEDVETIVDNTNSHNDITNPVTPSINDLVSKLEMAYKSSREVLQSFDRKSSFHRSGSTVTKERSVSVPVSPVNRHIILDDERALSLSQSNIVITNLSLPEDVEEDNPFADDESEDDDVVMNHAIKELRQEQEVENQANGDDHAAAADDLDTDVNADSPLVAKISKVASNEVKIEISQEIVIGEDHDVAEEDHVVDQGEDSTPETVLVVDEIKSESIINVNEAKADDQTNLNQAQETLISEHIIDQTSDAHQINENESGDNMVTTDEAIPNSSGEGQSNDVVDQVNGNKSNGMEVDNASPATPDHSPFPGPKPRYSDDSSLHPSAHTTPSPMNLKPYKSFSGHPSDSSSHQQQQQLDREISVCITDKESLKQLQSLPLLKEGFLNKRGFVNTAFRRRWCKLHGNKLSFYRHFGDSNLRGWIDIKECTLVVSSELDAHFSPFIFCLNTPHDKNHKKWIFQSASDDERTSWMNVMEIAGWHYDKAAAVQASNHVIKNDQTATKDALKEEQCIIL